MGDFIVSNCSRVSQEAISKCSEIVCMFLRYIVILLLLVFFNRSGVCPQRGAKVGYKCDQYRNNPSLLLPAWFVDAAERPFPPGRPREDGLAGHHTAARSAPTPAGPEEAFHRRAAG